MNDLSVNEATYLTTEAKETSEKHLLCQDVSKGQKEEEEEEEESSFLFLLFRCSIII